ncbi:MAG: asparaginase domain-containing protein [Lachnospiraceae bacterium]|nr:asparaginase domain-containing protein [Lachnospiraceae bacterium]
MEIGLICTGGTIGSSVSTDGVIAPEGKKMLGIVDAFRGLGGDRENHHFQVESPYYILSENLTNKELNKLIAVIEKHLHDKKWKDGLIILHGTDTLAYTASVLGLCFADSKIPIVLVSAQTPLEDPHSNGLTNFDGAVTLIDHIRRERMKPEGANAAWGVMVSNCNPGESLEIHRAHHLLPQQIYSRRIESVGNDVMGRIFDGKFRKNESYVEDGIQELFYGIQKILIHRENDFSRQDLAALSKAAIGDFEALHKVKLRGGCPEFLMHSVAPATAYPKLRYGTEAVCLLSYHSGTIGITKELKKWMSEANRKKVKVFLCGLAEGDMEYETVSQYKDLGIIPLPRLSPAAVYAIFWVLGSLNW